ncbi:hypothetical protein AB5J52_48060 (plasmid) [Streptomyces sp. R39]|uniref:Uncharacterized protein n=1 Tax=Streptomyces sp. R39 TaxID=3238631 RepID=A0AB39R1W9_9ACTN
MRPGLLWEGEIRSRTHMLPAVEAKFELLRLIRRTPSVIDAFRDAEQSRPGSTLHTVYEAAIHALGPLSLTLAGDRFSLSYDGTYNDADEHWRDLWARKPHPDRRTR